jgi:hypothetical protein
MPLDKAIKHGKEYRKAYRKGKRASAGCRNHGNCSWCERGRTHSHRKRRRFADQDMREVIMGNVLCAGCGDPLPVGAEDSLCERCEEQVATPACAWVKSEEE